MHFNKEISQNSPLNHTDFIYIIENFEIAELMSAEYAKLTNEPLEKIYKNMWREIELFQK